MLTALATVFVGGGTGAALRYAIGEALTAKLGDKWPMGTIVVNLVGSALIGAFMVWFAASSKSDTWRLALAVGFLGGFTTFSSFSQEILQLIQSGRTLDAFLTAVGQLILGVAFAAIGGFLAGRFVTPS